MIDGAQVSLEFAVPWVFYPGDRVPVAFAADSYGRLLPRLPLVDSYAQVITTGIIRLTPALPVLTGSGLTIIDASIDLIPPRISISAQADIFMRLSAVSQTGWQPARQVSGENAGTWQHGAPRVGVDMADWEPASPRQGTSSIPWQHSAPIGGEHRADWQIAGPRQSEQGESWQHGPLAHSLYIGVWNGQTPVLSADHIAGYEHPPIRMAQYLDAWKHGAVRFADFLRAWQPGRIATAEHDARWNHGRLDMQWPPIIIIPPLPPTPGRPLDDGSRIAIPFLGGWVFIPGDRVPIPFGLEIEPPLPGSIIVIVPTFSAVRLPDRTAFQPLSLSLDLSQDKSSWEASMGLLCDADYDIIRPPETEIEIMLQGYTWRLVVVSIQAGRTFGQTTFQVTARSPSIYLGPDWAPTYTGLETNARTAQQLAVARLPFPWLLDWGTFDWLVPGGQFSYQNLTPAEIVKRIAETVGAAVLPDMMLDTLHIRPRHSAPSWLWGNLLNLYTIPPDLVLSSFFNPSERNLTANAVYLAGIQVGGSRARVKKFGTAGDIIYREEPTSALLTHADAFREAGLQILSHAGRIGTQSLRLPLLPTGQHPRLLEIGEVIEVGDGKETFRGLVVQNRIQFRFGDLPTQAVELERY